jgi:crotonobetainyl-CoA:carnitine CoA-transferase CaiB-like acyl-CoA transferase
VSTFEAMTIAFNQFQAVAAQLDGRGPEPEAIGRFVDVPSVEPTADGWVGFATNGSAQFRAFAELVGHPEWADHPELGRVDRRGEHDRMLRAEIAAFTTARTTEEVLALASERRIPVAPLGNGETLPGLAPFVEREVFVEHPDGVMVQPRVPYRLGGASTRPFGPVAPLGADTASLRMEPRHARVTRVTAGCDPARPLAGLRVFDFTSYWAGPYAAQILGFLGADVVKVESVQRPDGTRMGTAYSSVGERPWELAPLFHGANTNKREVTLDFTQPEGLALARRLLATCDVLIENYTPRVLERFGLLDDDLRRTNPGLVVLRMPAWGLDGAWRDRPGFAQTMEQVTGLAWVTGHEEGAPTVPRGPCDPLGGLHAVFALLTALEHRERAGEGMVVEAPLVESALNVAAEQVAVYRATGQLLGREGNRSRFAAPQNVYRVGDGDCWLALAVETEEQWLALRDALGDPEWARDPAFADAAGRRAAHDDIDTALAAAFAPGDRDELVARLCDAGVPVAPVVNPRVVVDNEQHAARGFYEPVVHPVAGPVRIPGFPAVWDVRDAPWHHRAAPLLGEHNDELLAELGVEGEQRAALVADRVIGDRPVS